MTGTEFNGLAGPGLTLLYSFGAKVVLAGGVTGREVPAAFEPVCVLGSPPFMATQPAIRQKRNKAGIMRNVVTVLHKLHQTLLPF